MATTQDFYSHLQTELQGIRDAGLYKAERVISSAQGPHIHTVAADGSTREVLNLCANNYLGLSSHPTVVAAAADALTTHGYGLSSGRPPRRR